MKKKSMGLAFLFAIFLLLAIALAVPYNGGKYDTGKFEGSKVFLRGDANGDGSIDISDPIVNLNVIFRGGSFYCLDANDANDDGIINVADVIYVLRAIFSGGPAIPPPYPDVGIDKTEDEFDCGCYPASAC